MPRKPRLPASRRAVLLLLTGLAALPPPPLSAAAGSWTPLGPDGGGWIRALAADPVAAGVVYAALEDGGIFKSSDGGESWAPASEGLGGFDLVSLAVAPSSPQVVYAGGRRRMVYKSTDGGAHWAPQQLPFRPFLPDLILFLAVDPRSADTVYAGADVGLFRTGDGGATWEAIDEGLPTYPAIRSLALDPSDSDVVYVGAGDGLFKTTDGGATWAAASAGLPELPYVLALAVDPSTPSTVFASVVAPQHGLYKSVDGGGSWSQVGEDAPLGIQTLAIDPSSPATLYALTPSAGVFKSVDGGVTWAAVNAGLPDLDLSRLALDADPGAVYVGSLGGEGIFRSRDAGASWAAANHGLAGTRAAVAGLDFLRHRLFVNVETQGILASDDGGATWSPADEGISGGEPQLLALDPADPDRLYASVGPPDGTLFRSDDGGASWQPWSTGLRAAGRLVVDPTDPEVLYGVERYGGGVYKSTDAGSTWTFEGDLANGGLAGLAIDPSAPSTLFAAGATRMTTFPPKGPEGLVFRSTDGGVSWQQLDPGIQTTAAGPIWVVPGAPSRVYVSLYPGGLYESADGGTSWAPTRLADRVDALAFDPATPSTLYAGVPDQGVLASADGGATWEPINAGLTSAAVRSLLVDPSSPDTLYAGTHGGGAFRYTVPSSAACQAGAPTLCLHGGRFRATIRWRDFRGRTGAGSSIPLDSTTGGFWFFSPGDLEVAVKVLDGRRINGHFWVFYAGLSNVGYTLTVTDAVTGAQWTTTNPRGRLASRADVRALPGSAGAAAALPDTAGATAAALPGGPAGFHIAGAGPGAVAAEARVVAQDATACTAGPRTLCLLGGRFRAEVRWEDFRDRQGPGRARPLSDATGAFWFFAPDNLELLVKIHDGRPLNGHFWVFYAGLSNVGYTLTVTDTATGAAQTYTNPVGSFTSRADVRAF